jgi:hypothetical protein
MGRVDDRIATVVLRTPSDAVRLVMVEGYHGYDLDAECEAPYPCQGVFQYGEVVLMQEDVGESAPRAQLAVPRGGIIVPNIDARERYSCAIALKFN